MTTSLDPPPTAASEVALAPAATDRWVGPAAVGAAVGGLALKAFVAFRGYFLVDDFLFQGRAARLPFLTNLTQEHAGHLMPGGMLVAWISTEAAPLNHTFAVLVTLGAVAVSYAVCWRALCTLVGRRPAALGPFLVYCLTPLLLPATVWWAAALNALPLQIAAWIAVDHYVRYRRTGAARDLAVTLAAVAGGLMFFEKAVLIPLMPVSYTHLTLPTKA